MDAVLSRRPSLPSTLAGRWRAARPWADSHMDQPALTLSASPTVRQFDRAMQRAMAAVLLCAVAQAVAVTAAGHQLYPSWWWMAPGPVGVLGTCLAAVQCWRSRFDRRWRLGSALVVGVCAALTTVALPPAFAVGSALLPLSVLMLVAIGFLERPLSGLGAAALLIGPFIATLVLVRPGQTAEHTAVLAVLVFAVLASIGGGYLARLMAAREERAFARLQGAIAADRMATATRADRRESERELHDTVLNTLTAVGRGSLVDSAGLRTRCAADAQFLRDLLRREESVQVRSPDLGEQLGSLIRSFDAAGFPVSLRPVVTSSADLPPAVVQALTRAVREALNNARAHSGASSAEVEVRRDHGQLTIVVRDRGRGSARSSQDRLGIRGSILERMADVGGRAEVRCPPGAGTSVSLCWPT